MFCAFALLNLIGYDNENGWTYGRTRTKARVYLAREREGWTARLAEAGLVEPLTRAGGAMLMDLLPFMAPGTYTLETVDVGQRTPWQRCAKEELAGVDGWLEQFSREVPIDGLWESCQGDYQRLGQLVRPCTDRLLDIVSRFPEPLDKLKELVVLPNLLDMRGRGYSLSAGERTWLYLGPVETEQDAERILVHELLHRWVDPLAAALVNEAGGTEVMPVAKARYRLVAESYPEAEVWLSEIVVRAATLKITATQDEQARTRFLSRSEAEGLIGISDAFDRFDNRQRLWSEMLQTITAVVRDRITRELTN